MTLQAPATRPAAVEAARRREQAAIHNATCRYRAQGLVCSLCRDLERAAERGAGGTGS